VEKNKSSFDFQSVKNLKAHLAEKKASWVYHPNNEKDDDVAEFLFVGKYEGKEVVFDVAICTLFLCYEQMIFEAADAEVQELLPKYGEWVALMQQDPDRLPPLEKELEAKANEMRDGIMDELDEESMGVQEFMEIEQESDEVYVVNLGLNVETITNEAISDFVKKYNEGTFKLDEDFYSFGESEEEDNEKE
jgi:hypothetical protein